MRRREVRMAYNPADDRAGTRKPLTISCVVDRSTTHHPQGDPMTRFPTRLSASRPLAGIAGIAAVAALATFGLAMPAAAQFPGVTLPPSGGNQRATVVQQIGLVRVSVDYSSPHVHSPAGEDRKGQIWGKLVPYGMANLGFGSCGDQCPWRGGANENTVFTTSQDIMDQGQPLHA